MSREALRLLAKAVIALASLVLLGVAAFGAPVPRPKPLPPPLKEEEVCGRWHIVAGFDGKTHEWTMVLWAGGRYECARPAEAARGQAQYVGEWSMKGDELTVSERHIDSCPWSVPNSVYTVTVKRGKSGSVIAGKHSFLAGRWDRTE